MRSLGFRVTLQSVVPQLVLAAILCAAAGTPSYWQAWAWIGVQIAGMTATNVYFLARDRAFLESRLGLLAGKEKDPVQRRVMARMGLVALGLVVVAGLDRRLGWSHVPALLSVAACAAMAAGTLGIFLTFLVNRHGSSTIEVRERQQVVTTGPYRVARHPMYTSFLLMGLATPVALGSWWAATLLVPLVALLVVRLLAEERLLEAQLPGYAEYMRTTRTRLVPGIW